MSKPMQILGREKLKAIVDDLETRLHQAGFKRAVFQIESTLWPIPIYRE
jgi:hypothetical protein